MAVDVVSLVLGAILSTFTKQLTEAGLEKGKQLVGRLRERFKGEPTVAAALVEAESQQSEAILKERVAPFLQVEMLKDPGFTEEIRALAEQVNSLSQIQTSGQTQFHSQENKDIGQQLNIQNLQGGVTFNLNPE